MVSQERVAYQLRQMIEKAEARKAKIETELLQINVNLILWENQLNGGASLDHWLESRVTENMRD